MVSVLPDRSLVANQPEASVITTARFLVGDVRAAPKTRGTYGIRNLFDRCSVAVSEYRGQPKVDWASEILATLSNEQLITVLARLVSSEENGGEDQARVALNSLNAELIICGYRLAQVGDSYVLSQIEANQKRFLLSHADTFGLANPDFEQLDLSDEEARRLTVGWDEAVRCYGAGAYLATMVMLGSLLEAVLLLALSRNRKEVKAHGIRFNDNKNQEKAIEKWTLNEMIEASSRIGWITPKVSAFAHSLREYRNYVHPELQKRISELPRSHECLIGSGVVSGAVHDLKSTINVR